MKRGDVLTPLPEGHTCIIHRAGETFWHLPGDEVVFKRGDSYEWDTGSDTIRGIVNRNFVRAAVRMEARGRCSLVS